MVFLINDTESTELLYWENVFWSLLYTIYKINFMDIAVINVKGKTIKLLEGNMGEYLLDFDWIRQIFLKDYKKC